MLLKHSRGCDGRTSAGVCPICRRIDRQLLDGSRYAVDDREQREAMIKKALIGTQRLAERLTDVLEGAPVQSSTRSSSLQISEWLTKILFMFDAPLTGGAMRQTAELSSLASGEKKVRPQRVRIEIEA